MCSVTWVYKLFQRMKDREIGLTNQVSLIVAVVTMAMKPLSGRGTGLVKEECVGSEFVDK